MRERKGREVAREAEGKGRYVYNILYSDRMYVYHFLNGRRNVLTLFVIVI